MDYKSLNELIFNGASALSGILVAVLAVFASLKGSPSQRGSVHPEVLKKFDSGMRLALTALILGLLTMGIASSLVAIDAKMVWPSALALSLTGITLVVTGVILVRG